MTDIEGRKSGGEPDKPYEADDTLRTAAVAKILDLLGEGEWEGLVDGEASIFFDDTPMAVRDASSIDGFKRNFKGVKWAFRRGLPDQSYIPAFASTTNEVNIGVEIKKDLPVTRTIIDENVDAVAVRISLPGLRKSDGNGNVYGSEVTLKVFVKAYDDAAFVEKVTIPIKGKASTRFERAVTVNLQGQGPWQLRVERVSDDATDTNYNQTVFAGMTEIIYARLRYPYAVLCGLEFDAAYFDALPVRSYDVKMQKIQVPINRSFDAATDTVTYLGPWDGRMKAAREWCDNPAWCLYDMLTSNRYGLGEYLVDDGEVLVDRAALYQFGKYCDELVNGRRRFTLNAYFQSQAEAYDLVNQMASVFRGMAMWGNGSVLFAQDSPSDPEFIFTQANVENGLFTYQSNSRKERVTTAHVYWTDPQQGYRRVMVPVEDRNAVLRYGYNPTSLNAIGCANREQAIQMGKWMVYGSCYETNTVAFKTGMQAAFLKPGAVIQVQDEHRAGQRIAGRITEVPGTYTVMLDKEILIEAGRTYTLGLMYPSSSQGAPVVRTAQVTSLPGYHKTLTHAGGFPTLPERSMVFVVSSRDLSPQTYRVTGVKEVEQGQYQVTAIDHNAGKYDFIERAEPLPVTSSVAGARPRMPLAVSATDELYLDAASLRILLRIEFDPASTASQHFVRYRRESTNWVTLGPVETPYMEIPDVLEGDYEIEVWSKSILGLDGEHARIDYTVLGKQRPPQDTHVIDAVLQHAGILVTMAPVTDLDFDVLELRWAVTNTGWSDAALVDRVKGTTALLTAAFGKGTEFWFFAKALDTSGNYSAGMVPFKLTVQLPSPPRHVTAVANLGYIDMHWEAADRADFYEVRAGNDWATGEFIGQTSDLAYSFEWARPGNAYFWVEAFDALGNPSGRPAAVNKDVAKTSGRNVVYEVDYAGMAWPGRLLNLVNSGISLDVASGRFYGEYISAFSIAHRHRVLLAMDGRVNATYEPGTTWEDLTFPWDDPQADIPWWMPGDVSQVEVAHYIATDLDPLAPVDASLLDRWTFEDTLDGEADDATATGTPTYRAGIFNSNGLEITPTKGAFVDKVIPATFGLHVWHIFDNARDSILLRLKDDSDNELVVGYDVDTRTLFARRSEGEQVSVTRTLGTDDPAFIGISQGAETLRIFVWKHGVPHNYAEIPIASAHGYTYLRLN